MNCRFCGERVPLNPLNPYNDVCECCRLVRTKYPHPSSQQHPPILSADRGWVTPKPMLEYLERSMT